MIGYVISIVGIGVMSLGFDMFTWDVGILAGVPSSYVAGAGIVAVVVGILIALKSGGGRRNKAEQSNEEVPIYEGVGKKRKIVGYRKG